MNNTSENNQVTLIGTIGSNFMFDHNFHGEGFYKFYLNIQRTSSTCDVLPIIISKRQLLDANEDMTGQKVGITGQLRTLNTIGEGRRNLIITVFARNMMEIYSGESRDANMIRLDGYVCRSPVCRRTPLGRDIADILLAVNHPYGKSYYIPCICWGRHALYADQLDIGTKIRVGGRIQSREHNKKLYDGIYKENIQLKVYETRTAYEVSVHQIERVESNDI